MEREPCLGLFKVLQLKGKIVEANCLTGPRVQRKCKALLLSAFFGMSDSGDKCHEPVMDSECLFVVNSSLRTYCLQ